MLNTEHNYYEAGYRCARARLERDEARATHWKRWFTDARALESEYDQEEARRLFERGYLDAQPRGTTWRV